MLRRPYRLVAPESKGEFLPHSEKIALLRSTVLNAQDAFRGSAKIQVKSAQPGWISLRLEPDMESRAQVVALFRSQIENLPSDLCEKLSLALDELLGNAIEHGCDTPYCRVEFDFIRTARMLLLHVKDAGPGFSIDEIPHAALNNPPEEPLRHVEYRSQNGMRPGGFGIMMVKQIADELMYNQQGNEVLMVKYLD
jgi:anti-sigma regulatory factor (Ser/Thr protein kinase)